MHQYEDFMRHVFEHGTDKHDRTGTGTRSVFGYQMRFPLGEGFPLVTTKKLHLRSIIHELLWFLRGGAGDVAQALGGRGEAARRVVDVDLVGDAAQHRLGGGEVVVPGDGDHQRGLAGGVLELQLCQPKCHDVLG